MSFRHATSSYFWTLVLLVNLADVNALRIGQYNADDPPSQATSNTKEKLEAANNINEDDDEDPGGPPTIVDVDNGGLKFKAMLEGAQKYVSKESAQKYAYITMFINETLMNEEQDIHPKLMSYDAARLEALDRWVQMMSWAGLPFQKPPEEIYDDVHKIDSKKGHARKGKKPNSVKSITKLADNLRKVGSNYPLVVLSNEPTIINMHTKAHPNVVVVPWTGDFLRNQCKMYFLNSLHIQKLKIFNMTEYDKLMWLDTDLEIKKNIDDLFALDTSGGKHIYGQIDDYWLCKNQTKVKNIQKTAYGFCSGMMLFSPSQASFEGLQEQQTKMSNNICWGDQSLIQAYFGKEKTSLHGHDSREIKLFGKSTVSFPYCAADDVAVIHYSDPQS